MDELDQSVIESAVARVSERVHRTPVMTSRVLDALAGCKLFFKCENLQRSGSFKIRGAMNAALQTPRDAALVTQSSGNHGAALALAGRELNRAVTVVVPAASPAIKIANIERYGARVVLCGPTIMDREAAVATVLEQGGVYIPPYNHPHVISGQGTLAHELLQQTGELDELWVPVGGGGMASGCVTAVGTRLQVVGAEPELADDAFESLATGKLLGPRPPRTIADGLRGALGEITFEILRDYKLPIQRVSEATIVAAQKLLMDCLKIVVEPSGAVAFAALLIRNSVNANSGLELPTNPEAARVVSNASRALQDTQFTMPTNAEQRVGIVISGGNLDLALSG